ncbi:MAG: hypothetical protein AAF600_02780 [Bacteroidota bacterium]
MNSIARGVIFFLFLLISLISLVSFFIVPFLKLLNISKGIDNETAASEIAQFFPNIEDKLLNLLQLGKHNSLDNELIKAAIDKKAKELEKISFTNAIDFSAVKKYAVGFIVVLICFSLVSFISPEIIRDSSSRIANYSREYERASPFQFTLLNQNLEAFKGEDYTVNFRIAGDLLPEDVKLLIEGENSRALEVQHSDMYSFTFEKIRDDKTIQINASGFLSKRYEIKIRERPNLLSMDISIKNPNYTGGERINVSNTGDITILEGSKVRWSIKALSTKKAKILFNGDTINLQRQGENQFIAESRIFKSGTYQILLANQFSKNSSELSYNITVIEDLFPEIIAEFFPDSSTYQFITVAGTVSDDYGFSKLMLHYRKDNEQSINEIPLEVKPKNTRQSFYVNWDIDSLNLSAGSRLEIYVSVSDNDGVNGAKKSKSKTFIFRIPTEEVIDRMLSKKSENVENELDAAKKDAEEISGRLSEIEDRLKTEQKFDWQEQKLLQDIIKDREKLNSELSELQKKHRQLQKANNQFKKQSKQLQTKNEKLQELLKQLMDEETRKLYKKLRELMKQNAPKDQISEQLKKLQRNEQNLEKDMERALELLKRLKMESALEQNLQKLDTLSTKQEKIADEEDLNISQELQENIKEQFKDFRKNMDEIKEMNQELKRPEALEDFEYEERQIAKELREIQKQIEQTKRQENKSGNNQDEESQNQSKEKGEQNNDQQDDQKQPFKQNRKRLRQKQQDAAQKMKSLSQKLSGMQGGMQMEMMQASLDQLRDILDNLIKLSFNQEEIMNEMKEVNQSDPRFLTLSQDQLKLKDDAKVIQDSLLSLASRVVQISSFVTKEIDKINISINESLNYLKDRNRGRSLTSQQFAMTSINNLALLLDDTMQQMQMTMMEAMGNSSGQKEQPQEIPDMQDLQNQLGDKIKELKESGKTGRQLSEELARLAAEQEMIRRQLEMLKRVEKGRPAGGKAGDELQKAIDMMEQNEIDLVNKHLTEQLIFRQKQIDTRLLEADKAKREQETEKEREADKPSVVSREVPPEFEEYLKLKKREIELLKTIPIELNPFYKKEVNDYFRRLSTEQKE